MYSLCVNEVKLDELKNYMLYSLNNINNKNSKNIKFLENDSKNELENGENGENKEKTNIKHIKNLSSIDYNKMQRKYNEKKKLFYQDKLFWCFYKLYKNAEDSDIEHLNIMKEEKDFKINIVDKIHNNKEFKDLLKKHKFKKNTIEDDLLNNKSINLKTFECLIMLHKMNIFIIKNNNTYTYFNYNIGDDIIDDDSPNINDYEKFINYKFIKIEHENVSKSCKTFQIIEENINNLFIKNILDNYYYLQNFDKPLKAFSAYKLDELNNICNKLKIIIYNGSKKKTKKELYEEIYKLLN